MTGFLLAFVLIMTVIMILSQAVTVRVIYRGELVIRIEFLLFELILYPTRNKKRRPKENRKLRIRRGISSAFAARKAIGYLFLRSRVTVRELDLAERRASNPAELAIISQNSRTLINIILAYLALKSESLVTENTPMIISDTDYKSPLTIDVSLSSTMLGIISSFVVYSLNLHRYKRKRRRKIV